MGDLKEIYDILYNAEQFSMSLYNKLIKKYNRDLVNQVIEKLILENDENIEKFSVYLDNVNDLLESRMELLNYSIYISDLKKLECFNSNKNIEMLSKIHEYIEQMDIIFREYGCDLLVIDRKVPWIADKVKFCLDNCNDLDVLNRLNDLYRDYCNIRDEIVKGNLRLVINNARRYSSDMTLMEDMIQYGNIGLIRAIEKFDINKNTSFVTYASYWIMQSIIRGIKTNKYSMRMPIHVIYKNASMMDAISDLSILKGRSITNIELSEYVGISLKEMELLVNAFMTPASLDEIFTFEYDESDYVKSEGEYIADDSVDVLESGISLEYRKQLLAYLSECLIEREFTVLNLYYGFSGKSYTDKEIAKEMGISQQRVGQIKRDALIKLRRKRNIRDIVIV